MLAVAARSLAESGSALQIALTTRTAESATRMVELRGRLTEVRALQATARGIAQGRPAAPAKPVQLAAVPVPVAARAVSHA